MGRQSTPSRRIVHHERPDASSTGPPPGRPWTIRPLPGRADWTRKPFLLAALGVVAFVVAFGVTRRRGTTAPGSGVAARSGGARAEAPRGMVWIPTGAF